MQPWVRVLSLQLTDGVMICNYHWQARHVQYCWKMSAQETLVRLTWLILHVNRGCPPF